MQINQLISVNFGTLQLPGTSESCFVEGEEGHLLWEKNWVTFLDSMMQMTLLSQPGESLVLPTGIKYLSINPLQHKEKALTIGHNREGLFITPKRSLKFQIKKDVFSRGLKLLDNCSVRD